MPLNFKGRFMRRRRPDLRPTDTPQPPVQTANDPSFDAHILPLTQRAHRLYYAVFQRPLQQADRSALVAFAFFLVALVEGIALYQVVPLKQQTPYFVEWDARSGAVWISDRVAERFTPETANKTFFLRQWATWLLTIKPNPSDSIDVDIPKATRWTIGTATDQLTDYFAKVDPIGVRIADQPGLTREVTENSTTYSVDGKQAYMLLTLQERVNGKEFGEPKTKLLTIRFLLSTDKQAIDEQRSNPLGVKIEWWTLTDYFGPTSARIQGAQ
ncbi:type IV secretion system protein [Achromobacter xylosoxidans]|uniref:VirB8/TrbF family protein n=1 Tax=Alcaligenes xylosoxydans xylosoxydans TaxID=85698 RepID=UPI0019040895|nr:VirB8/TrbF family protein [Achromobacter xylosoxidans]MBK1982639.1 type IV secretion system protein [Achromobacter xylosoxidans]